MRDLTVKQKFIAFIYLTFILVVSFFRDHLFRSVNEQLRLNYYKEDQYSFSFLEPYISKLSDHRLYQLKYILTAVFVVAFCILCLLWIRNLFIRKDYSSYVIISYACVFLLSLLAYGTGILINQEDVCYSIARNVMEFIQSPIMILILTAVFWYDVRSDKD